ncbi:MAG: GHKL domain-containing protein [Clostridium sp.]|nr:GHKL domain-containing protein [Clostridium sp.]
MTAETFLIKFIIYLIVPSFAMSMLCCFGIYILYKDKLKAAEIRKFFLISFCVGAVLYTGSFVLVIPLLSLITILQLKNNTKKFETIILIYIYVIYLLDFTLDFIYIFLGNSYLSPSLKAVGLKSIIVLLSVTFLSFVLSTILKNTPTKKASKSVMRLKTIILVTVPLCVILTIILETIFYTLLNKKMIYFVIGFIVPDLIPLIFIIFVCVLIYNYDLDFELRDKLIREINEKNEIQEYSHIIEDMYGETRKFKHDYMNMILPLKAYVDSGDIEGVKNFFYDNVLHIDQNIKWNDSNIDKLKYLKIVELKAILSAKLIKALGFNIAIKVEIVEDIEYINMNLVDLCRITGILMDNAIEASKECEHPYIKVCIVNKKDYVILVFQNNFFGESPVLYNIFKKGFSTKGENRGLGLYIVKDIIDKKYDNVSLNTTLEENNLTQELWINHKL